MLGQRERGEIQVGSSKTRKNSQRATICSQQVKRGEKEKEGVNGKRVSKCQLRSGRGREPR
jgi:hypothetical protein